MNRPAKMSSKFKKVVYREYKKIAWTKVCDVGATHYGDERFYRNMMSLYQLGYSARRIGRLA